jgi:hypothetical protein
MTETRSFNDPRRLFKLWKELTGEDLGPTETYGKTQEEGSPEK